MSLVGSLLLSAAANAGSLECSSWIPVDRSPEELELWHIAAGDGELMAWGRSFPWRFVIDEGKWIPHRGIQTQTLNSVIWNGDAWIGFDRGIALRSDDGLSWKTITTIDPSYDPVYFETVAIHEDTIVAIGNLLVYPEQSWESRLAISHDNGSHWKLHPLDIGGGFGRIESLVWTGSRWLAFDPVSPQMSADGIAWSRIPGPGAAHSSHGNGVTLAIDEIGAAWRSLDEGESWASVEISALLSEIAWSGELFVAKDRFEALMWISDDGFDWRSTVFDGAEIDAVAGIGQRLVAVGENLATSADGGEGWEHSIELVLQQRAKIAVRYGDTVLAVAISGRPAISRDGGRSWLEGELEIPGLLPSSEIIWTGRNFLVNASDFRLYASTDGLSWQPSFDLPEGAYGLFADESGRLWAISGSRLLWSDDEGETWSSRFVDQLDSGELLRSVASAHGRLVVTISEAGANRETGVLTGSDPAAPLERIDLADNPRLVIVGDPGFLIVGRSLWFSPRGKSWHRVDPRVRTARTPPLWTGDRFLAWPGHEGAWSSLNGFDWQREHQLPIDPWVDRVIALDEGVLALSYASTKRIECGQRRSSLLPGAAHLEGFEGSMWRSDVAVSNPADRAVTLSLAYTSREGDDELVLERTLPAHGSLAIDDVLWRGFGRSGAASLRIDGWGEALAAVQRTYDLRPEGGFGQGIAAREIPDQPACGNRAILAGLLPGDGHRSNLGVVNHGDATTLRLQVFGSGTTTDRLEIELAAGESRQLNRILPASTGPIALRPECGDADQRLTFYASVIDESGGDAVFVEPTGLLAGGETAWIPGLARNDGAFGSTWRSELLLNATPEVGVEALLTLHHPGGSAGPLHLALGAGESRRLEDLVGQFGIDGGAIGELEVLAGALAFRAWTGDRSTTGGRGQAIPGLRPDDAAEQLWLTGLRQVDGISRSNLGLVNTGDRATEVLVEIFAASGESIGTLESELDSSSSSQIDGILRLVAEGDVAIAAARITSDDPIHAWASVVDSRSNDPILILAEPLEPEED